MKILTLISLGTAALVVVSASAAAVIPDTGPAGQAAQQKDRCNRPYTGRYPASWPEEWSAHRPNKPGSGITRHLYDHGGYRPGNW